MPTAINLEQSGLRRSRRIAELNSRQNPSTSVEPGRPSAHTTSVAKKASLILFGLFCTVANGTIAALSHQVELSKDTTTSLFSSATRSYHRANMLFDGTINCFSTLAMSAEASNEVYTYKQAMQQEDYRDFVKAMIVEVEDHERRSTNESIILLEAKATLASTRPSAARYFTSLQTSCREPMPKELMASSH